MEIIHNKENYEAKRSSLVKGSHVCVYGYCAKTSYDVLLKTNQWGETSALSTKRKGTVMLL